MTQTFNEDVEVRGNLQIQEATSPNNTLTTLTDDGRIQVGDDLGLSTPDALIEAHRAETSTTKPTRGIHSLGRIGGAISDAVAWMVSELELPGTGTITGIQQALRARLTHSNTGDSNGAELRAGEFEVVNQSGTSGTPVGQATGLRAGVTNESGAYLDKAVGVDITLTNDGNVDEAYGIQVADVDQGTSENFALYTGLGKIRFGDLGAGIVQADANGELSSGSVSTSDVERIGYVQPLSTPAPSILFQNLNMGNYKKVCCVIRYRGDGSGGSPIPRLQIIFDNNTTPSVYAHVSHYGISSPLSGGAVQSVQDFCCAAYATNKWDNGGAGASNVAFATYSFTIIPPRVSSEKVTTILGQGSTPIWGDYNYIHNDYGAYVQTSPPLDDIEFKLIGGSGEQFEVGTEVTLYGYK